MINGILSSGVVGTLRFRASLFLQITYTLQNLLVWFMEFFLLELLELLDFVEACSCRLLTLCKWRCMFCFVKGRVGRPVPGHRQVSPAARGREQNMALLGRPRAPAKNPSKITERRRADNEQGTPHQPSRGSLLVAQCCRGIFVPETDWETWHLFGQGSPDWHFPIECLIKLFTFGAPGLQSQISSFWPGLPRLTLSYWVPY